MNSLHNQFSPAIYDDFLQKHFVQPEFLNNLDVDLNNDNDNAKNSDNNDHHNHNHNHSHNHNEFLLPFYETPNSIISFSPQQSQIFDLTNNQQDYVNYFNYPSYNRSIKQYLLDRSNTNESFQQHHVLKQKTNNNNSTKEKELNKNNKDLDNSILNSFLFLVKPVDTKKQSIPSSVSNFQKNFKKLKEFKCDLCSNSFTRKTRLREHKNRIHLGKILRFECKFCGTVLSSRENLTRHQIVHTDKFKCSHCDKRFDRSYRFQRHVIKCNNDKIIIG